MPRFAANLDMLFTELPLLERFDAAASAGFQGVELLFPDAAPATDIAHALKASNLTLALINMPVPDWATGGRGLAAVPVAEALFRENFGRGLDLAGQLSAERLHILEGIASGTAAHATYRENLHWATRTAGQQQLTMEVINPFDIPGFFLSDLVQAEQVLTEIGAANLGLQFDAYHAHRITGDVLGSWEKYAHLVTHVQFADAPGRHEPGSGSIDLSSFFSTLDRTGYHGWAGAEYHPSGHTVAGLGWMTSALND